MITWNLNVAGLDRIALVRPASTGAKLGIFGLHGHSQHASTFGPKNFTPKDDVVQVFLQGLPDDGGVTGWIRPDTASFKYTWCSAKGHEDYDYIEAVLARAMASFPSVQAWAPLGFSGGAAVLRYLAHDRLFPFPAFGLCGNSMSTEHVTGGRFEAAGPLPPLYFQWGTKDDSPVDQPNMMPFEAATDVWAATYGATETSRKLVTVCGSSVQRREYSNPDFAVYAMQGVGHRMLNCPVDGSDDRFERFVRGRLGL